MFLILYRREMTVASRNLKLPVSLMANNCVLAVVAIFSFYLEFYSRSRLGQMVKGVTVLNIYSLMCVIEFGVAVVSMFLLTVPCILKERRNHTFDLLISAGTQPIKFLAAKLAARVTIVMTVIFSSCPILGLVFYIGGISVKNLLFMMFVLTVICFYIGAIGMLCSCVARKTIVATVNAYLFGFFVILGTLMIVSGCYVFKKVSMGIDLNDSDTIISVGRLTMILLVNPLYCFLRLLNEQLGTMKELFFYANLHESGARMLNERWVLYSCLVQMGLVMVMILYSARKLRGGKHSKGAILK